MPNPVPLASPPTWYAHADLTVKRNGVFYPGDVVSIKWSQALATSYTVYDFWGNVVSSGSISWSSSSFTPATPAGGWKFGWYRVVLTGPNSDPTFGTCYGVTNINFTTSDSRFIPLPTGVAAPQPSFDGGWDPVMTGCMGIGTSRLQIDHVDTGGTTGEFTLSAIENQVTNYFAPYWTTPGSQYIDPARPRNLWCSFPNGTVDIIGISATSGIYLWVYCKDGTIDGSTVIVSASSPSGTGCTITVQHPSGTTVETWNVTSAANAQSQINAGSNYIRVFVPTSGGGANPVTLAPQAIGNAFFNGLVAIVTALYPLGVTWFEGPRNEPTLSAAEAVQESLIFCAAVHKVAGAKAMGPSYVEIIDETNSNNWPAFLAAGGNAVGFDAIATHAYNAIENGDLNCGRNNLSKWVSLLQQYSLDTLPRWQTESTWEQTAASSVHHPRRASRGLLMTLLWEEYGIPREQNPWWYPWSHGFWGVEAFLMNEDGSLQPEAQMYRTLAEETWGMTWQSKFNLPHGADHFLLAHRYHSSSGDCAVFQLSSYIPGATITLATSATSLTVRDGFGNSSTVTPSGGSVTINISDVPTYVRIPTGTTLNVKTVLGWPAGEKTLLDGSTSVTISGTKTSAVTDGHFMYSWDDWSSGYPAGGGLVAGTAGIPDACIFKFPVNQSIRRVLVFCGPVFQRAGTLLTFTIDTSTDGGTTWTTQVTVDKSAGATTFAAASDQWNTGTQLETYYDEEYIFPVDLGATISCNALRINVTAATYGGEPNSAAYTVNGNATGYSIPQIVLQQVLFRG